MSAPYYQDGPVRLFHGDCIEVMRAMPDASVDSIVTDPPYGLGFMGREWDDLPPGLDFAVEALRVLKPGGHMLAFGGTRTWHRLAVAVEDAGFEIRDSIAWLYSQGFPKSMNVGADQRFCQCGMGELKHGSETGKHAVEQVGTVDVPGLLDRVSPLSDEAAGRSTADLLAAVSGQARRGLARSDGGEYEGPQTGGRAIRRGQPGVEGRRDVQTPSGQLRSPADGSVPSGVSVDGEVERLHSVAPARDGAVDRASVDALGVRESQGSRHVEQRAGEPGAVPDESGSQAGRGWPVCGGCGKPQVAGWGTALKPAFEPIVVGRKPLVGTVAANVLAHGTGALNIDGCRVEAGGDYHGLNVTQGMSGDPSSYTGPRSEPSKFTPAAGRWPTNVILDESQAAELDRQSGVLVSNGGRGPHRIKSTEAANANRVAYSDYTPTESAVYGDSGGASRFFPTFRYEAKAPSSERPNVDGTAHPTVKPLDLMAWLCRLVTPPGGIILEPFAGSGTTLEAALGEGFQVIGIEREADYLPLIMSRLQKPIEQTLFGGVA